MSPERATGHARVVRLGAYDIEGFIAEGGMGAVFEARHRMTGQRRALKLIRPELSADGDFVTRFMREVKLAASLRHSNVVEVLEPGMDGTAMFLPMELLTGETLASLLRRTGPLSPGDAATIMLCVCRGVTAIHGHGVLHRDLKPLNVFLARGRGSEIVPKVLDFGMARELRDTEHTATGLVMGSPHYMAPEQASGARDLDHRVDQYSLGAIAYEMLTGRRPHEQDDAGHVLSKLLRGDPYPAVRELDPAVPDAMARAVHRALARRPSERFPNVAAFGAAFAAPVAAQLGSASAAAALTGRALDLMETVGADRGPVPDKHYDPEAAEEATLLLDSLESSCIISVQTAETRAEPLADQDGTAILESLDASCVIEVDGIGRAPAHAPAEDHSITIPSKGLRVAALVAVVVSLLVGAAVAAVILLTRNPEASVQEGEIAPVPDLAATGGMPVQATPVHEPREDLVEQVLEAPDHDVASSEARAERAPGSSPQREHGAPQEARERQEREPARRDAPPAEPTEVRMPRRAQGSRTPPVRDDQRGQAIEPETECAPRNGIPCID